MKRETVVISIYISYDTIHKLALYCIMLKFQIEERTQNYLFQIFRNKLTRHITFFLH